MRNYLGMLVTRLDSGYGLVWDNLVSLRVLKLTPVNRFLYVNLAYPIIIDLRDVMPTHLN